VHNRATRKRRIRDGAWALVVALLPVTESRAAGKADDSPASADTTPVASTPNTGVPSTSARPKIPPPRRFAIGSVPVNGPAPAGSKVPSPRKFGAPAVRPAADLTAGAAAAATTGPLLDPTPVAGAQTGVAPQANLVPSSGPAPMPIPEPMPAPATMPEPTPTPTPTPEPIPTPEPTPTPMSSASAPAASLNDPEPPAMSEPAPRPKAPDVNPSQSPSSSVSSSAAPMVPTQDSAVKATKDDSEVEKTACASCGGFHSNSDGAALHDSLGGCANGSCIPGREPCDAPCRDCDTMVGAFLSNLYQCLCCPDPCYQPRWEPAANASLFADYARPRTVTRIRYDNLNDMRTPDRNQFFMQGVSTNKTASRGFAPQTRYQQVSLYQEVAGERGSFFINMPYNQINPNWQPTQAGFGDLNFGVKSLMFDCEMLQVTFQFRTYMPTGTSTDNLGTGHISLDPSILATLKLTPSTYVQTQIGQWIPIGFGGANGKSLTGGVLYWFNSLNQVLWYATPTSPLIATLEMDGWSFENGGYTSAVLPGGSTNVVQKGGGVSYFNIGPGLRQSICNKVDIGGAITWATTTPRWADPWFRFEVRFLF
jgi:hypothetical protein